MARKRTSKKGRRITRRWSRACRRCSRWFAKLRRAVARRLRPWCPAVEVDLQGRRGRRLRKTIGIVTRSHLTGLGVTPPEHLLVVVQRTVVLEERPLAALMQVFEDGPGRKRHVVFLALRAGEQKVGDEEVVATLRQQLQHIVATELGRVRSMPLAASSVQPEVELSPPMTAQGSTALDELVPSPEVFGSVGGAFPTLAGR